MTLIDGHLESSFPTACLLYLKWSYLAKQCRATIKMKIVHLYLMESLIAWLVLWLAVYCLLLKQFGLTRWLIRRSWWWADCWPTMWCRSSAWMVEVTANCHSEAVHCAKLWLVSLLLSLLLCDNTVTHTVVFYDCRLSTHTQQTTVVTCHACCFSLVLFCSRTDLFNTVVGTINQQTWL